MIELNVKKKLFFQENSMILDIELHIKKGSFTALYGKSGAGKTTLLKILAGLVKPDNGFIIHKGEVWNETDKKIFIKPQNRNIGFLFQDYALFPNMTVKENIQFGCEEKGDKDFIHQLLKVTLLSNMANKYPTILSGGQKQRVALARALARKPQLLLLDEPFSSLDTETKLNLYDELKRIHQLFGLTTILVSHSQEEVKKLCEKVVVIADGKIVMQGTPKEVFNEEMEVEGTILEITEKDNIQTAVIDVGVETIKNTLQKVHQLKTGDKIVIRKAADTR